MILFLVNSAFQMITAVQLRLTIFKEDEADIIITDDLAHQYDIAKGVVSSGIFKNVYTAKTKGYNWKNWKFVIAGRAYDSNLLHRLPFVIDNKYDIFLYCNYSGFCTCLASYLKRTQNTQLMMFEDGFISYTEHWRKHIQYSIEPSRFIEKVLYFFEKKSNYYVSKYWVFNPNLISDWNFNFTIEKIPNITENTISALNRIYNYDQCTDNYSSYKCIFFEESYYADGIDIRDLEIVDRVSTIIGKANMMIKIHPRNPENRFSKLGYKTNSNTEIPWEIIALNNDFSDTILMTIALGSSITSHFISGKDANKSIMLYDMKEIDKEKLTPSISIFDTICRKDPYFVFPKDFEDLQEILCGVLEDA